MSRVFFFAVLAISPLFSTTQAVTYEFSGGRFGDSLLCYLHAKWISYRRDIPLKYRPFEYSDLLVLHERESVYEKSALWDLSFTQWKIGSVFSFLPFVYRCEYFPESKWELARDHYPFFQVEWKDPAFRALVKKMVAPRVPLQLTYPPKGVVSIAIHVRQGGTFEKIDFKAYPAFCLKLPPLKYYQDALRTVLSLLPEKKVYCHLFTDAVEPEKIALALQAAIPVGREVEFGYRKEKNDHNLNVLEDFFSFENFDALIRSQSNYSMIPSLLYDFAIVCSPSSYVIDNENVVIKDVEVEVNQWRLDRVGS